jgi:hypothetical protein
MGRGILTIFLRFVGDSQMDGFLMLVRYLVVDLVMR